MLLFHTRKLPYRYGIQNADLEYPYQNDAGISLQLIFSLGRCLLTYYLISVVDLKLFLLDPDPTLRLFLDPDSNPKQLFSAEAFFSKLWPYVDFESSTVNFIVQEKYLPICVYKIPVPAPILLFNYFYMAICKYQFLLIVSDPTGSTSVNDGLFTFLITFSNADWN